QKLDIMDGCHGFDLLDLRFQRNAVLRLLICTDSDVTDRFCFHILKKLDHMRGGSHKLSGVPPHAAGVGPAKTPAGGTEASHRQHTERAATPATGFRNLSPRRRTEGETPKTVAGVA